MLPSGRFCHNYALYQATVEIYFSQPCRADLRTDTSETSSSAQRTDTSEASSSTVTCARRT